MSRYFFLSAMVLSAALCSSPVRSQNVSDGIRQPAAFSQPVVQPANFVLVDEDDGFNPFVDEGPASGGRVADPAYDPPYDPAYGADALAEGSGRCDGCATGCDTAPCGSCASSCDACCDSGCPTCGGCLSCGGLLEPLCCCDPEPCRLFPSGIGGIEVRGWIDGGITFNDDHPASNFNGPVTFNDREEEFQVNQVYLIVEKAAETDGCNPWAIGGRIDLLYGTDSRFVEVDGLAAESNGQEFYGLAIPQAYVEVAAGDLWAKVGHFYTITGYETVMAPDNFFYSHAYTMQYGEPFTHTGVLAGYQASDKLTLLGGIDRGWDNFNPNPDGDNIGYLGGLVWENECSGTSFAWTFTAGSESANPFITGLKDGRYLSSIVLQQALGERFTYVFQQDYGVQVSGSPYTGLQADWYGLNQYLFYKLSCTWDLGVRVEWFRDDDGARVGGIGGRNHGSPIPPFGFAGDFYNVTLGANWKPTSNLAFRPEVRWDWFNGRSIFGPSPFGDGGLRARPDKGQVTAAFDLIYQF